jgi:hypothetical protein
VSKQHIEGQIDRLSPAEQKVIENWAALLIETNDLASKT